MIGNFIFFWLPKTKEEIEYKKWFEKNKNKLKENFDDFFKKLKENDKK